MKIVDLSVHVVRLPFRFSFKHSLASRDRSDNVIVAATIERDGQKFSGYGESIPRDYVTGEDAQSAARAIKEEYAPRLAGKSFPTAGHLHAHLRHEFADLQLDKKMKGASWCAFELALLDAASRCDNVPLAESAGHILPQHKSGIRYGAVIPFGNKRAFTAVLWFYKAYGFKTVKIKVGKDFDGDLARIKLARQVLGADVILRVDANCAWTADEAIQRAQAFRPFAIASYEQPVPADDLAGLAKVSHAIPELVLADESLCSVEQARNLAQAGICSAFNIRISKVGGFFAAGEIADIAKENGIARHLGAQVGESGILSAAGRSFAATQELFDNYEGSNNFFLLRRDLTRENLNVGHGGIGKLLPGAGLGVTVLPDRLKALAAESNSGKSALVTTNQTA